MSLTYAVLGAGHGGLALAGHLGYRGLRVILWARRWESLQGVAGSGGIQLSGAINGVGPVQVVPELHNVIQAADVILVAIPASAHSELAQMCAPYLRPDQSIMLLPGRTAGAIEFVHALGLRRRPVVGEASTFPYASRKVGPAAVQILGIKRQVLAAALPASSTQELLNRVRPAIPQLMPARWVWKTSLDNMGAILHPAVLLLNTARSETTGGAYNHYLDGISPSVGALLEQLDRERVLVARTLGVSALTALEWLVDVYGVEAPTLYQAIQATPAYASVRAPSSLDHRYIWEDVPTGLVPIAALGEALGISTPTTDMVINLANALTGVDHRRGGRNLMRLGLHGRTVDELRLHAMKGDVMLNA